ncbi:GGDEF domain-containing protein [Undibacterium sp. TJN19]|uniref:GGDEF domain-containing protein n=1 Tax=Undibacterium sp. TJN19 TaxID=3413055 RepID=UPI003BF36902
MRLLLWHFRAGFIKIRTSIKPGNLSFCKDLLSDQIETNTNKQRKNLTKAAQIDQLTQVLERSYFISCVSEKIAKRLEPIAIVLLDLDRFRKINATYGFTVGDYILAEVCSKIKTLLDEEDLFGRMQGDEFAICLVGASSEMALRLAEQCRLAILEMDIEKRAPGVKLTASLGVATIDTQGLTTFEDTLNAARGALLFAKGIGGNSVNG